jgi:hypothetical protein
VNSQGGNASNRQFRQLITQLRQISEQDAELALASGTPAGD